ncbi:response regulator [Rhizobium sp. HT1-10]|uniref:response regulator n=1 Tax=Rhizobium sp. HT1-10 TaxID=3111638 RepID=UPI003C26F0A6
MSDDRIQWIEARAYGIWEEQGKPWGLDHQHWWQASLERDLLEATRASHDGSEIVARRLAAEELARRAVAASGATVLVVDDEPYVRLDTIDALESAGFNTYEAENAGDALAIMQDSPAHALLTDIVMPGSMDGVTLASKVRALWPRTQVVIASGMIRLARKDLARGMHFFPKPVPLPALVDIMRKRIVIA